MMTMIKSSSPIASVKAQLDIYFNDHGVLQ